MTFDKEDGTGGSNSVSATYTEDMPSAVMPTRAGYSFAGYWDGDNGTGTKYYNADGSSAKAWDKTAAATLYAKWNPVTLTFNGSGTSWNTATNWTPNCVPTIDHDVVIMKSCYVANNNAKAKSVTIHNYGDESATQGRLYIDDAGGGLVVAQGISAVHEDGGAPEGTTDWDLWIETYTEHNAGLVCGAASDNTVATYKFFSKIYRYGTYWVNQYIGIPFTEMDPWQLYGLYIFQYNPAEDKWAKPGDGDLQPWTAYNLINKTSEAWTYYYIDGTLNLPGTSGTQTFTCGDRTSTMFDGESHETTNGDYMFANSWTAPISIKDISMEEEDGEVDGLLGEIHIFNAGYVPKGGAAIDKTLGDLAGQWSTYSLGASSYMENAVIPATQAFCVTATKANATLTLNYGKHVYTPALENGLNTSPTRAPRRRVRAEGDPTILRINVMGDSAIADNVYLFEREDFVYGYDNGWDGHKFMGLTNVPQIYGIQGEGKLSIDAIPDMEGTEIGFKAGTDTNTYVLQFEYNDSEPLYVYDRETQIFTRINNEASYEFLTNDTDEHARFVITRSNAPMIETGVGDVKDDVNRAEKFFENNMLFIRRGDKVYHVDGSVVK